MEKNTGSECEETGGRREGDERAGETETGAQVTEVSVPSHNKWSVNSDIRDIGEGTRRRCIHFIMRDMINWG